MAGHSTVITRKGQVTIPVSIRRALQLKEGDRVTFLQEGSEARLVPVGSVVDRTAGILSGYQRAEVPTIKELKQAAEEAIAADVMTRLNRP